MLRRTALGLGVLATLFLPHTACGEKKGGLMLAVSTDMRAPKDINVVSVSIQVGPQIKYNFIGRVTPEGEVLLPATLAIVEPDDPNATIRVRIIAFKDRKPRVLRDVLTTAPRNGRLALLRMPLSFVNDGSATGELPEANLPARTASRPLFPAGIGLRADPFNPYGAEVASACLDPDQTTIDGECTSARVDAETLPEYSDARVYGATGACYDASACSAGWRKANVDLTTCTAPKEGDVANVTLVTTGTGHCNDAGKCFVPIDREDGWTDDGATIRLPRGVCKKVREGAEVGFIAGSACPVKTASVPVCSGVSPPAPATPGPPVTSEKVLDVALASAVAVFPDHLTYGSRDGIFVATGGVSTPVTPAPPPNNGPWFVAVDSAAIAFASAEPIQAGSGRVFTLNGTSAAATALPGPAGGTVRGVLFAGSTLYVGATDTRNGGNIFEILNSNAFGLLSLARDVSAFGRFSDNQLLVADGTGGIALCTRGPSFIGCATTVATAAGPVDAVGVSSDDIAFVQRPEALFKAQRVAGSLEASRFLEADLAGITDGAAYFPRGVAVLPKCAFYASPAGLDFVSTDGTTMGTLFAGAGVLAPVVSVDQVYFVVRAPIADGGGIHRSKVPASCL